MLLIFDVNETLSDMSPLGGVFASVGAPEALARVWFASVLRDGFALTATGDYQAFSAIAQTLLRDVLAGPDLNVEADEAVDVIMSAFTSLSVHPDVAAGVRTLRDAGHRLVTLSNGAVSVAEGLLSRAGVRDCFEELLSVDDAGLWKPAAEAYGYALDRCHVRPDAAVLVAVHPWDLHGAARVGLHTAWVNRQGRTYPGVFAAPTWQVGSVGELVTVAA